jgi:6-phosphogluconate dehydrogenase
LKTLEANYDKEDLDEAIKPISERLCSIYPKEVPPEHRLFHEMVHTDYLEQIIDEAHNAVRKQLSFGLPKPSPIAETAANIFYSITEAEDCKRSLIQRCRDLVVGATKEEYGKTHWEFGIAANLVFT